MKKLTVGELFAGIGGIGLGLERTGGFEVRWQVEQSDFCRAVLAKHWPEVSRYGRVEDVGAHNLERVDLISGGFPCQPVSQAGKRKAKQDERWLWPQFKRVLCELRPRYVLVENVSGLLVRGMGTVLGDLACLGYDAEWESIPAAALGAPHLRYRVFIMAYANDDRRARSLNEGHRTTARKISQRRIKLQPGSETGGGNRWLAEPPLDRVVDGVPSKLDKARHAALGNAVVPQVAEWIGARILEAERALSEKGAA